MEKPINIQVPHAQTEGDPHWVKNLNLHFLRFDYSKLQAKGSHILRMYTLERLVHLHSMTSSAMKLLPIKDAVTVLLNRALARLARLGEVLSEFDFFISPAHFTNWFTYGNNWRKLLWTLILDSLIIHPQFLKARDCVSDTLTCSKGVPHYPTFYSCFWNFSIE